ncbi:hypothetical protein [Micromonospora maris]|nr:hypothetical protein [Micromonospora maris]
MMAGMARGGIRWLGSLVVGVLAVVAGVWVLVTQLTADQLSQADQVASVVAAVVAVGGVPLAAYGVILARRALLSPPASGASGGGRVVQKVRADGDATVAGGNLTVGRGRGRRDGGQSGGGWVEQDVQAGRDASVAGGDLHVEEGRDLR